MIVQRKVTPDGKEHPVVWSASSNVIGAARTERGAVNIAVRKGLRGKNERTTAEFVLREDDDTGLREKAWLVGNQLITTGARLR